MTEKKYITGADVLRALADGHRVRKPHEWTDGGFIRFNGVRLVDEENDHFGANAGFADKWEIVEEPATDAELVEKIRQLADMLEKRSVKP